MGETHSALRQCVDSLGILAVAIHRIEGSPKTAGHLRWRSGVPMHRVRGEQHRRSLYRQLSPSEVQVAGHLLRPAIISLPTPVSSPRGTALSYSYSVHSFLNSATTLPVTPLNHPQTPPPQPHLSPINPKFLHNFTNHPPTPPSPNGDRRICSSSTPPPPAPRFPRSHPAQFPLHPPKVSGLQPLAHFGVRRNYYS
jgi:hypothetical protein